MNSHRSNAGRLHRPFVRVKMPPEAVASFAPRIQKLPPRPESDPRINEDEAKTKFLDELQAKWKGKQ